MITKWKHEQVIKATRCLLFVLGTKIFKSETIQLFHWISFPHYWTQFIFFQYVRMCLNVFIIKYRSFECKKITNIEFKQRRSLEPIELYTDAFYCRSLSNNLKRISFRTTHQNWVNGSSPPHRRLYASTDPKNCQTIGVKPLAKQRSRFDLLSG